MVAADSGPDLPDDLDVLRQGLQQNNTSDLRRDLHRGLVAPVFHHNHGYHGLLYAHAYTRSVQSWIILHSFLSPSKYSVTELPVSPNAHTLLHSLVTFMSEEIFETVCFVSLIPRMHFLKCKVHETLYSLLIYQCSFVCLLLVSGGT